MGWQQDLAREKDPWLRQHKPAAASRRGDYNQFERRLANIDYDQKKGFSSGVDDRKIWSKKGDRDYGERWDVKLGRNISGMAGDIKDFVTPPGLASLLPMFGSAVKSQVRAAENEEILGDLYTDKVRKEMMSPSDRKFYEKYMRLGDMRSGKEADYYYDQAKTALRNAQITNRVNYALNDLGFDTSAVAAQTPFGKDQPAVDYGTLSSRLRSGLEGTKTGDAFLKKHAIPKSGDTDYMKSVISDFNQSDLNRILAPTATDADRLYYQSRPELVAKLIAAQEAEKYEPPFYDTVETTDLMERGVELPAYSDAPTSILEDYDAQDLGGPLRWRVGEAFHPIDTSGYTGFDEPDWDPLYEDEREDARLDDLTRSIQNRWKEEQRLREDLLGRGAGLDTPRTMRWPNTLPPGFVPGRPYDDFPMVNAPVYPEDKEEWINNYFGPYGPETTTEYDEELRNYRPGKGLLWEPPWNYQR